MGLPLGKRFNLVERPGQRLEVGGFSVAPERLAEPPRPCGRGGRAPIVERQDSDKSFTRKQKPSISVKSENEGVQRNSPKTVGQGLVSSFPLTEKLAIA